MFNKRRFATVAGFASVALLALAPNAHANWHSTLDTVGVGFESRRWEDESFSEVEFQLCKTNWKSESTHVKLWYVRDYQPDVGFDDKRFTDCFGWDDYDYSSVGQWHDLPHRNYYFSIAAIDDSGGTSLRMSADTVIVDTTAAD
ncbi:MULTISPECIES: hypothetical protein [unclassified Streptomyces]|uniref:hypothetical protein n=1 Tax=unclassified Streptomyces TaxID=2593676 RepID=UPI00336A169F